jgi:aspartyl-tRNA(Asn)/glutamyl-tRNA(Gln) amidotransferase subunit B
MVQETRLYDPDRNETRSMRSKEDAHDYRYFPDPDLPPLVIDDAWIERVRTEMPELPESMADRFVADYGVPMADAVQLTVSREMARYFESTLQAPVGVHLSGKTAANWILGEISARLNRDGIEIEQAPVRPAQFAQLLARFQDNTISGSIAKEVLDAMWTGEIGGDADAIIAAKGLRQISDSGAIEKLVDDVLAANAAIVAEYKAGKEKAFNSLVGKAMAATKGKANPAQVNAILKRKLAG